MRRSKENKMGMRRNSKKIITRSNYSLRLAVKMIKLNEKIKSYVIMP